jgi:hypothetical protein
LRDLGWPPIVLLELTLDYLAESPDSKSAIVFSGYPPGYEAEAYPGTYDPLSAGNVSPLVNCVEACRTRPTDVLGDFVDEFEMADSDSVGVAEALGAIYESCQTPGASETEIGDRLRSASSALLEHLQTHSDQALLERIHRLGRRHTPEVRDHRFIHDHLAKHLTTMAPAH